MNTIPHPAPWPRNLFAILWLVLTISISACNGNTPTPPPDSFEYYLHLQEKNTSNDIANAQVKIAIAGQPMIANVTDRFGITIIYVDSSRENQTALLTVEAAGYKKESQFFTLKKGQLPNIIPLEAEQSPSTTATPEPATPIPSSTETPTPVTPTPSSTPTPMPPTPIDTPTLEPCPWTGYVDGGPTPSLGGQNCLNHLKTVGISENAEKISFFAGKNARGTYGACQDISNEKNVEFSVAVRDDIISARFLVSIGSIPVPNKSTHAFRIQPQIVSKTVTDMYLKWIDYDSLGSGTERDVMKAHPLWHTGREWRFHFAVAFSGSKTTATVNAMPSTYIWASNPASRYLCFAYEAIPTAKDAAVLEAHVTFP